MKPSFQYTKFATRYNAVMAAEAATDTSTPDKALFDAVPKEDRPVVCV